MLLWSTVATSFELSLGRVSTVQLLVGSIASSFLFLLVVTLTTSWRELLRHATWSGLLRSAGLAVVNPLLYYVVLFAAYDRLPGHQALILNYSWPVFLAILAGPILGDRPGIRTLIGMVISFGGVIIVYIRRLGGASTDPVGVALALGSSILWAIFWPLNAADKRPALVKLTFGFAFGTVYALVLAVLTSSAPLPSPSSIPLVAYVGLAEMGLSFLLWLRGLERSSHPGSLASLAYAAPFLSLILLRTVMGEEITALSIVGLVLIIGGIVLGRTSAARQT